MKTVRTTLSDLKLSYPLEKHAALEEILFLDIETTGFTAKSSSLYLIGAIYYVSGTFHLIQWFAGNPSEEKEVLAAFLEFSKRFSFFIHFNGNNFDLPYLMEKAKQYELETDFYMQKGIDLYKRIAPYKMFLRLPNCKQKTIETFLNISREDKYHGGELISIYHDFVKNPTDFSYQLLILHNAEDMQGMVKMLPILAYTDLFNEPLKVTKVQANYYKDMDGKKRQELLMKIKLPSPLPISFSCGSNGCYFTGSMTEGNLKVPLFEGELKYFYANYKDYYYLPFEDVAIHKSVATFVDSEHRAKASAATCYTRKESTYLPQWDVLFEPFFKPDYKSKELYFELTDELKKDRVLFSKYASHVLQNMI